MFQDAGKGRKVDRRAALDSNGTCLFFSSGSQQPSSHGLTWQKTFYTPEFQSYDCLERPVWTVGLSIPW